MESIAQIIKVQGIRYPDLTDLAIAAINAIRRDLKDNEEAQTDKPNRVTTGRRRCVTRDHAGRHK